MHGPTPVGLARLDPGLAPRVGTHSSQTRPRVGPGVGTHSSQTGPRVGPGSGLTRSTVCPRSQLIVSSRGFPTPPRTGASVMHTSVKYHLQTPTRVLLVHGGRCTVVGPNLPLTSNRAKRPSQGKRLVPRVVRVQTVTFIVFDPLLPSPWSVRPPLTAARSI